MGHLAGSIYRRVPSNIFSNLFCWLFPKGMSCSCRRAVLRYERCVSNYACKGMERRTKGIRNLSSWMYKCVRFCCSFLQTAVPSSYRRSLAFSGSVDSISTSYAVPWGYYEEHNKGLEERRGWPIDVSGLIIQNMQQTRPEGCHRCFDIKASSKDKQNEHRLQRRRRASLVRK